MTKNNQKKSSTVSRERFDRAVSDIYRERDRYTELQETTVSRARFDRAISDIRRLRAELETAYAAGASAVLNSDVVNAYVPRRVRKNLRPGRFATRAQRSTQG